jgi:ABC-type glycerol-3-phosphate transport system permease component
VLDDGYWQRNQQCNRGIRFCPGSFQILRILVCRNVGDIGLAWAGHNDSDFCPISQSRLVRNLLALNRPCILWFTVLHIPLDSVLQDVAESAKVDGANEWTIFIRLILPLSKPALATCALFAFLGAWNDFLGPLLYLSDPSKYTLAYGLQQFLSNFYVNWMQLMAASTLFTIPIVVLFFFAQKTFIQGIATTGGK